MANNSCDFLLAQDIAPDCENPQVGGMENLAILINRADVDFATLVKDPTNAAIVKTLAIKVGKQGYSVLQTGATPFSGTQTAFTAGTYRNKFTKDLQFLIPDHSPDICKNVVDNLANGVFVAVVQNKYKGADGKAKYEIYGLEGGLRMTEAPRDANSADTDGGWLVKMQEVAPSSGIFLWDTDEATTDAAFEALLVPVTTQAQI